MIYSFVTKNVFLGLKFYTPAVARLIFFRGIFWYHYLRSLSNYYLLEITHHKILKLFCLNMWNLFGSKIRPNFFRPKIFFMPKWFFRTKNWKFWFFCLKNLTLPLCYVFSTFFLASLSFFCLFCTKGALWCLKNTKIWENQSRHHKCLDENFEYNFVAKSYNSYLPGPEVTSIK